MKSSLETLRPVSPAAPRESTANSPKTAIRKLERSNPSERALAVAWRSRRSAIPSQRCLLVVSRCSRAPSQPSSESLALSMAHIHLLVEGVMLCCIPACCLRWNLPGSHWQKNKDIFKRLKQMQRIRSQSRLNDRPTSDFLGKERWSLQCRWLRAPATTIWCSSRASNSSPRRQSCYLEQHSAGNSSAARIRAWKNWSRWKETICAVLIWDFLPGTISMASISTSGSRNTAILPERLSEWKLKVPFPHVRILKEMSTIKMFIFVTLANEFHYCLLPVLKQLPLILPQALKTEMNIMTSQKQVWTAEQNIFSCIKIFWSSFKRSLDVWEAGIFYTQCSEFLSRGQVFRILCSKRYFSVISRCYKK